MSNYDTIYNTFRPSTFDEVFGQEHVVQPLLHQLKNNTLPHSLILFGPPGVGKTTVARLLAKAYNQSSSGLREIDAAQDRKVETIRQLIPKFSYAPMEGDYLTVIFDEAHQMTPDAFQALQKVVEEPPEKVRFIFVTTRIDKIPSTIVSRSQRHGFTRIENKLIYQRLFEVSSKLNQETTQELLNYAVQVADGSMRDALVALGQIFSLQEQSAVDIAEALGILGGPKIANFLFLYLKRATFKELLEAAEMFESERLDNYRAMSDFQQYVVDAICYLRDDRCVNYLKFNVCDLISKIDQIAISGGHSLASIRDMMRKELEKVYILSLEAEERIAKTKNTTSAFRMFVNSLVNSWA